MGTSKCALYMCNVTQRNVANKSAYTWKSDGSFFILVVTYTLEYN